MLKKKFYDFAGVWEGLKKNLTSSLAFCDFFYRIIGMTFEEALTKIGVNTSDVLARFSGNESLMKKFILKFPQDKSFPDTKAALASGDKKALEISAHTLKGVSGNLGFSELYETSAALVNAVRAGEEEKIKPLGEKVALLGDTIISILSQVQQ